MASKLDQLFRENLDQLEIKPSGEAWGQVKDQLTRKKNPAWIWPARVAAAVTIMLTAVFIIINLSEDERQPVISSVDHPVEESEIEEIEMPFLIAKNKASKPPSPTGKPADLTVKEKQPAQEGEASFDEEMKLINVAGLSSPKLDVGLSPRKLRMHQSKEEAEEQYIRITYIASSGKTTTESPKEESKLNKVISIARDVSTSDILADIREAKDNLFRRNN